MTTALDPEWNVALERPFARTAYGRLPTPLEFRRDISAQLGVDFFLKREDAIDDVGSGHKLRKLNYVIDTARRENATLLLTAGSLPSGQTVAVAAAARRYGLRSHLIYLGDRQERPAELRGNYLLATLLSNSITWFERRPWVQWPACLADVAERETKRGERVYVIPPGITSWPGLLGSIDLGIELTREIPDDNVHVVAPAGTGGTCLGISIAALGRPWKIHGICIGGSRAVVECSIDSQRTEAAARLERPELHAAAVSVTECALGGGYDQPEPGELLEMRRVLREYRLLFDPNYMIKAFRGAQQLIRDRTIPAGARVVLVHTGGTFGIFGGRAGAADMETT